MMANLEPGIFGADNIGFGIREDFHFLTDPVFTPERRDFIMQAAVDVHQMGNIGEGILQLLLRERAGAPVGEAAAFVKLDMQDSVHQVFVTDGGAEAAELGGNLGVVERMRDETAEFVKNFDVLAAGMENLDYLRIVKQAEKGGEV